MLRSHNRRGGERVVLHARSVSPENAPRLAVVASRRVGSAVARNRAKRLVREAARGLGWKRGTDIVVVARRECAGSRAQEVAAELAVLGQALDVIEDP
ncbi:MAG: ribonuclease P protein component [Actinomycetota bacterium]|nr:ribonuclease P protein component [Actinomycetota bacterium]